MVHTKSSNADLSEQAEPAARLRELAHDFNNLLAVIMGNASMMQKSVAAHSAMGQALAEIVTAAERGALLTQQILAKPASSTAGAGARNARPPRGEETILVVEDSAEVADMIKRLLTSLGYCVIGHSSAEAALGFLETNADDVALVTCDMELPGINGRQFRERVRSLYPRIAVVIISGSAPLDADGSSPAETEAPFLLKPFSLMDLAKAVRGALDHRPT